MGYAVNHSGAFTRFFADGRLPLTNNAAERTMRPIAVGRGNWLFAGSVRGGRAAAVILSFVESAKLHGLNPFQYLRDVLTRLSSALGSQRRRTPTSTSYCHTFGSPPDSDLPRHLW